MSPARVVPWRSVSLEPVVLVFGPQDFFADRAIKIVKEQFSQGENLEVVEVDANEYLSGDIFDLAGAGLFGDRKMVIIQGVERCSDALITDGVEYLKDPSADAVVIFRHNGKSVRGKKLLEAIRDSDKAVEATCTEISRVVDRLAFIEAEFKANGRKIQRQAANSLAEIFSSDIEELAAACSQLQSDDAGEITPEIVEKYFGGRLESNGFKIADSALAGRTAESVLLLRHALDQGFEPVLIVSALAKSVGTMAKIIGNPRATPQSVGVADWALNKARVAVASWAEDDLAYVINEIAETDFAIKGGQKDPVFAMERLVRLIANKGRVNN